MACQQPLTLLSLANHGRPSLRLVEYIQTLSPNIRPLEPSELSETSPVVSLQIAHSMQQDIRENTKEIMPANNIWIHLIDGTANALIRWSRSVRSTQNVNSASY